ncbi:MAG: hypothetical protein CL760_10185 [Chloroflexi bacterium]|nr:hypothetical protein [Chloroflexota bacterium]|tara:strand:- start:11363 stop:11896 length:534 start_codon:yes stop_codon:yes gene_type:complete
MIDEKKITKTIELAFKVSNNNFSPTKREIIFWSFLVPIVISFYGYIILSSSDLTQNIRIFIAVLETLCIVGAIFYYYKLNYFSYKKERKKYIIGKVQLRKNIKSLNEEEYLNFLEYFKKKSHDRESIYKHIIKPLLSKKNASSAFFENHVLSDDEEILYAHLFLKEEKNNEIEIDND